MAAGNPTTTATELDPGSPSPLVQPPLENQSPIVLPTGLENPYVLPAPAQGDLGAPVRRPNTVQSFIPPLQTAQGLKIAQGSIALPVGQSASQQNLVPLVALPVLSRSGLGTAWAIQVAIAGLTTVQVRATYRDLRISAGVRGMQLQYGAGVSAVVRENITGMIYSFPSGPHTIFVPLFMLKEVLDLTITGSGNFPAGSTCLLTTEEQVPYMF